MKIWGYMKLTHMLVLLRDLQMWKSLIIKNSKTMLIWICKIWGLTLFIFQILISGTFT